MPTSHSRTAVLGSVLLLAGCATGSHAPTMPAAPHVDSSDVRALLSALADDSMEGRMTASDGSAMAARFIAAQMHRAGLAPGGDSGYFQRIPMEMAEREGRSARLALLPSFADEDTVPASRRRAGVNLVGILRGGDPAVRDQVILVDAHYDHLGIGQPVNGDSIYNGADDDGSGTVAVLEIARALAQGPAPKRTIIFLAATGEEVGLLGTRWYIAHPVVPLTRMVANLEIEMIGRPDSLAGGPGHAWLTGYDRSTMGEMLRTAGIPIVADPRPDQHFFERSDNIAYARAGIPAHTLSSFNLHDDYHQPSDEVSRIDFTHMTRVVDAAVRAVRLIANGTPPVWNPGGQPGK